MAERIAVLGAGAWGTALALAAERAGRQVTLWARRPDLAEELNRSRENTRYLPGPILGPAIQITSRAEDLAAAELLLLVLPAQHLRATLAVLAPQLPRVPAVICAKGIELATGRLLDAVVEETLPGATPAVLSGPSFAAEVARGLPAAVTLAAYDPALGRHLVERLGSATFRPYWSEDVTGVLIGGAVKNVIAIACGIVAGRRLGENARAALVTRGLAEIARLSRALDGRPETVMGLSGLGDLVLTCSSSQSRNFSLGQALGEGHALTTILAGRSSVAEGVATADAVVRLAARLGIEMPIAKAVSAVLHEGAAIEQAIGALLARPFKAEDL